MRDENVVAADVRRLSQKTFLIGYGSLQGLKPNYFISINARLKPCSSAADHHFIYWLVFFRSRRFFPFIYRTPMKARLATHL